MVFPCHINKDIEVLQCQRMANEAGKRSRKCVLQGIAEITGVVLSGEEKVQGAPHCSLQLPERRL